MSSGNNWQNLQVRVAVRQAETNEVLLATQLLRQVKHHPLYVCMKLGRLTDACMAPLIADDMRQRDEATLLAMLERMNSIAQFGLHG